MRRLMEKPRYIRAPIKLLAAFVLLSALPLAMLSWLGWSFLDQDRALEVQRQRERLENAASLAARDLDHALALWERLLSAESPTELPNASVRIVFDSNGIRSHEGVAL